jgi:hypothetical protein
MLHPIFRARTVVVAISLTGLMMGGCSKDRSASVQPSPSSSGVAQSPVPRASVSPGQSSAVLPSQSPSSNPSSQPSVTLSTQDQSTVDKSIQVVSQAGAIAKQDTGKTYISNLLLSQQAEHLVRGRFASDLKRLAPDVPTETEDYHLEIRQADASQTVLVATAKQPGFNSYTGVVYAIAGKIPVTGICKTNVPSQTPPQAPKLVQSAIMCPQGSSQTN